MCVSPARKTRNDVKSPEEVKAALEKVIDGVFDNIAKHNEHAWKQIGRCVYCDDCGERLYQGRIPKSHTNVVSGRKKPVEPASTTEMRARWNK